MYIAPGRGRQSIGDKVLMTTERPFLCAHILQVSKWSLRNLILNTFFMILYLYIARGKGRKPLGGKLLMSTENPYDFDHLLPVSNKSLWILILSTFFNVFPHVYSHRAGRDNPLWTKSWCQQKSLVTLPICCKFQKNIFWSLILYTIFHVFVHVYIAQGKGQTTPWGQNFI